MIVYPLHRYLVKVLQQVQSGVPVTGSASYLSKKRAQRATIDSRLQIDSLVEAYEHRAARCANLTCLFFFTLRYCSTYVVSYLAVMCMASLAYRLLLRFQSYLFMLYCRLLLTRLLLLLYNLFICPLFIYKFHIWLLRN